MIAQFWLLHVKAELISDKNMYNLTLGRGFFYFYGIFIKEISDDVQSTS